MTRDAQLAPAPTGRPRAARRWAIGIGWLAAALLVAGASPSQAAPPPPIAVENLYIGFGTTNAFQVGTWTPVWVQLRAGDDRFEGFMEVVAADDDGTPTSFVTRVDVGARSSQPFTAYIRPGSRDPDLTIRLYDRDRRRVASIPQDAVLPLPPRVMMPQEEMILTMGRPQGVESITELPGFQEGAQARRVNPGAADQIVVTRLDPRTAKLPGRWYGYDAARAIVVDTSDPDVLRSLDGLRGQSLVEWVRRGGHLIVAVGGNWQAVSDSVLGPILPGKPVGQETVSSLAALDQFAGSTKQITPPGAARAKYMVTKLEEVESRGGAVLAGVTSGLPLLVRGPCGFGRVTLIALDVDQKIFSDWPDRNLFWVRALDLHRRGPEQGTAGFVMGGGGRFYRWGISDLAGQLRAGLEQFPGVRLVPFGWVAFFIFLYILLIGPGDYFFLKKVLRRMELTWITFPTIVVAVSLLAYYAAYVFKGSDLLVNQVDVVDVDQTTGLMRGATWAGLFSPQNRDYSLRVLPLPVDRPAADAGASSEAARPAAGTEVLMTWFSSPEDQFGAMGSSSRRFNFGNSGYAYAGFDDPDGVGASGAVESLRGVRIPIWSTKCVTARWFGPAGPLLDSDIQPAGSDRLSGTVTNRLDVPLKDAIVAFGKHVYLLGEVAPGSTTRIELARGGDRNLSGYLKEKQRSYLDTSGSNAEFQIDRSDLLVAAMFHDSELRLSNEQSLVNDTLHDLDLTGQLLLPRPMLVARVDRPGSRLVIDNAPSPPKVTRSTLIRVILPLKKAKPEH